MGSTKIKTVDMSQPIDDEPKTSKTKKETKQEKTDTEAKTEKPVQKRVRSKTYIYARSQVDKTKLYPIKAAVELVKKISRKNHPTLTADINYKELGFQTEIALPYSTGKTTKVKIADEKLLEQLEKGAAKLDFDILLATPDIMKRLAKHARLLGPKGLMPNPKNKTITANPQKRKQELEAGKLTVRTEKKAPIIHVQIGSINQPDEEIIANLTALVKALNPAKIRRLTLSSTMSPGIKIDLDSIASQ